MQAIGTASTVVGGSISLIDHEDSSYRGQKTAGRKRRSSVSDDISDGGSKVAKLESVDRTSMASDVIVSDGVEGEGGGELIHLLIRFPDGRRAEKSFPANQRLQVIYNGSYHFLLSFFSLSLLHLKDFLLLLLLIIIIIIIIIIILLLQVLFRYLKEEGISMTDHEVVTTYPRCLLSSLPHTYTFKQAKLCHRQTVFVQLVD